MKNMLLIIIIGLFSNIFTMEVQKKSYLELAPQELKQMIFPLALHLNEIKTFDELLQKLQTLSQIEHFKYHSQELYKQLSQFQNIQTYDDALTRIQALSKSNEFAVLFDDPDFNRILLSYIYTTLHDPFNLGKVPLPYDIAKDLRNIRGAQEWIKQNALVNAPRLRRIERVQELLDQGVNVNARDRFAKTALMYAASEGYTKLVKLLIDHKANVNAQDMHGYTALMEGVESKKKK